MKATEQTTQQIERAIKKIAQKFPTDEETSILTDVHLRVSQDSGEILAFDDNEQEITRCVVEQWIDNKDDDFSEGAYGGNVDGFGCHVQQTTDVGNVFRYCRAWRNSDDGFDLIHCFAPVEIDHCIAMYNGFRPTADFKNTTEFVSAGDGNGFKAGGWGMKPHVTRCPEKCPQHYVHHCLAYQNKANGIYSNHHLSGNKWEYNTSAMNRHDNYNMVNRKSTAINVDVAGYDHILIGNVSWNPRAQHIAKCDTARSSLINNTFAPTAISVSDADFVSTDPSRLFVARDAEGNLPAIDFLVAKKESVLSKLALGWKTIVEK